MKLRRGFKTETESISREVRSLLDLGSIDPLDPWELANELCIPIMELSTLKKEIPDDVNHFFNVEQNAFSAVTIFEGKKRMIVHNDSHSEPRQVSNITHELAHALLLHPPTPPLNDTGCRNYNQAVEEEANWLAGTLLIPAEAALNIVIKQISIVAAAFEYGVSKEMVTYRLNVTGARKRVGRMHA